jgi:hypothetical protein
MNYPVLRIVLITLTMLSSPLLHCQQALPVLQGTFSDVTTINTAILLSKMNQGSSDLVLVAAHRGYWVNSPENSDPAIRAAFNSGIEIIEIDVRTTSDGQLVVSHDPDLVKETIGTGLISANTLSDIQSLPLRDRHGFVTNLHMLSFADVLSILQAYSGRGYGPVIIVDLKDQNPWPAYQKGVQAVASTLDSSTQPAVVFKMKMKLIPSIGQVQTEASAHPSYGHLIPTVNPEDATGTWAPTSSNFQTLLSLSNNVPNFIQQFELNINGSGDGASQYTHILSSYATYYEPRFYPEGVSTITIVDGNPLTNCCYLPNPISTDLRGVLPFATYYPGTSLITTDNLAETLNFLSSSGKRNLSVFP